MSLKIYFVRLDYVKLELYNPVSKVEAFELGKREQNEGYKILIASFWMNEVSFFVVENIYSKTSTLPLPLYLKIENPI